MVAPGSGIISLGKLGNEKRATSTSNNYNEGPYTAGSTKLAYLHENSSNGGYGSVGVNTANQPYPNSTAPYGITEWYGYDHLATS